MKDNKNLETNKDIDNAKFETAVVEDIGLNCKITNGKIDTSLFFKDNKHGIIATPYVKLKTRGFEVVDDKFRKNPNAKIELPARADKESAGYDFRTPIDVTINPMEQVLIWTDVKAYMQPHEVLMLYVRSSLGIKKGLTLANTVGVIDSSYYDNPDNDGNIGICLVNRGMKPVTLKAGKRICQGIFTIYLPTDDDNFLGDKRIGGFGSSGNI